MVVLLTGLKMWHESEERIFAEKAKEETETEIRQFMTTNFFWNYSVTAIVS